MKTEFFTLEPCYVQAIADIESATFADAYSMKIVGECASSPLYGMSAVMTIDNRVCGYIISTVVCGEAEIQRIAIDSDFRGAGYGSQLLNEFINRCKNNGIYTLLLEVRDSNTAARALYEKFGFKVVGIRKCYYADNNEDAVLYTLNMIGGD